jgi:putative PIG3 family NAD(P)H quinone oxidoreductase
VRAVVVEQPGDPEVMDVAEVPDPTPGPGEVLLRVHATALNRADLLQRRGFYPPPPGTSPILGMEAAGEIAALGPGVAGWQVGDRACALLAGGGYAELVAVPAGQLMAVPDNLDIVAAAAVPEVFITAHDNLVTRARLHAGETVLVHGGAGGVGTAAIQLAHRLGARVLATAGSAAKLAVCLDLGADAAIDHTTEDFTVRARELTGGRGVDVVLDIMGASYLARNLSALAPDGRLVIIGLQGGINADIDLNAMLRQRLTIIATTLRGRSLEQKAAIVRAAAADLLPGLADGSLRPIVDRVLPLDQVVEAHRAMEAGENIGKIVLSMATASWEPGVAARLSARQGSRTTFYTRPDAEERGPSSSVRANVVEEPLVPTPSEIFTEINSRLEADPSKAAGMNASYQFDLSGDDGGEYHIVMKDGAGEAGAGGVENPNITISMASTDFVDLTTGKLDGTMAFMSGKIKIKGDMGLAMKLQSVLR